MYIYGMHIEIYNIIIEWNHILKFSAFLFNKKQILS